MSVIDEIKSKLDIVDLVSETVKLRKSGRTFTGFCPFHANTRTPSFVVWPETDTWRCFGACNTGGDIFSFVMKRDNCDFGEALQVLAHRAGVELAPPTPAQQVADEEAERLRAALEAAVTYFHNLLQNAPQARGAREYLDKRGLTPETITHFQLGYSLDDWHALESYLGARNLARAELVQAGLLTEREDGKVYDRFRGRLMFPIRDGRGRMIGFGARTLSGEEPKYLNSPQTALFDKSATLYALDLARAAIRQANVAVIVEGYMDAIAAHQAGFANVVASMGTALTEAQFKLLTRLANKLVLALDPDTAGLQSMLRGLDVARATLERDLAPVFDPKGLIGYEARLKADIRVAVMPDELDPDEVIRANPEQWTGLIANALPVIEYVIQTLSAGRDLNDPKEKAALSQQVVPLIQDVANPSERAYYAQKLARVIGADAYVLQRQIAAGGPVAPVRRARPSASAPVPVKAEHSDARMLKELEAYCLSALLRAPGALDDIDDTFDQVDLPQFSAEDFTDQAYGQLFTLIRQVAGRCEDIIELAEQVRARMDSSLLPALDEVDALPARPGDEPALGATQSALRLRHLNVQRRQRELQALIQAVNDAPEGADENWIQVQRANTDALRKLDRVMRSHEWLQNTGGM